MSKNCEPVAEIIQEVIKLTAYEAYLRKEADFDQRWENVKELINFGATVTLEFQPKDFANAVVASPLIRTSAREVKARTVVQDGSTHDIVQCRVAGR